MTTGQVVQVSLTIAQIDALIAATCLQDAEWEGFDRLDRQQAAQKRALDNAASALLTAKREAQS